MPPRATELFAAIASFEALHRAALVAVRGKRAKPGAAAFIANLEKELLRLEASLWDGTWRSGGYTVIDVRDPKPRRVSAAPFRDRVVHHAVCAVVAPLFERGFIADTYANRKGFGTHRAIARYEHFRDRHRHVLRADIYRFFPAIDHAILKADFRRRVACPRTLELLDAIVDGSNPQEPVALLFPGDAPAEVAARRRGLPIGNLTSQWFANIYLDGFDHYVKEVLRAPYLRYVDDFALFHDQSGQLEAWHIAIAQYLIGRRLMLHPQKTWIVPTASDTDFLGFTLCGNGRRRLPEDNVRRLRNRLRGLRDRWRAGTITGEAVRQRLSAWIAHARHADSVGLRHALFHGGWFDPLWEPEGPPVGHVLRGGSWNNKPENARSANRNRNDTGNRNNNNGFRIASTLARAGADSVMAESGVPGSVHGSS